MVRGGWDVEQEYCPCTSSLCLASVKNTVKRQGAWDARSVCNSCDVPRRTASTSIAAVVLDELSCLHIDSQSVTQSSKKVIPKGLRWIHCTVAAEACY